MPHPGTPQEEGIWGIYTRSNTNQMSPPFGLKVPHILRKAINPHPKRKNSLLGPPKKRGVENPYKEKHKYHHHCALVIG
jgi:hypothetical protein